MKWQEHGAWGTAWLGLGMVLVVLVASDDSTFAALSLCLFILVSCSLPCLIEVWGGAPDEIDDRARRRLEALERDYEFDEALKRGERPRRTLTERLEYDIGVAPVGAGARRAPGPSAQERDERRARLAKYTRTMIKEHDRAR